MNIGLRHLFPAYPPLYITAGVAAARLYSWRPRLLRPAFLVLALGLAIESFTSYPDYIPFFNAAAGGARGGYRILGDSNLDWGQDLPLLAEWQRKHPNRTLYLAYFGTADPAYYGIRYRDLPWGYSYAPGEPPTTLPSTGVVAISVGTLQGILFPDPPNDHTYDAFRHRRPDEVLGGSIYLFDLGGD